MFILRDMVEKEGIADWFQIDAAATSTEELGNPVYPPAFRTLSEHGINASGHRAHQLSAKEYREYDYVIAMDQWNLRNIERIAGKDKEGRLSLLLDHTDRPGEVDDPWYTRDFDTAYEEITRGCEGLLREIRRTYGI